MKKILLLLPLLALMSCATMDREKGSITVSGRGTVLAVPDTAQLNITVSERAASTKEAQNLTNQKIALVLQALKEAGIGDKNLQTSAINFSNDYVWNQELRRNEMVGQVVSQSVTVIYEDLNMSPSLLAASLDVLGSIDGLEIGNLQFSIDDPQEFYQKARKLAFEKASQKAEELAAYSLMTLGNVLNISEIQSGFYPLSGNVMLQRSMAEMEYDQSSSSDIPGGEVTISYEIQVVYEMYPK